MIGDILQKSGITQNDFSVPLTYTVISHDKTSQDYTVTVIAGPGYSVGGTVTGLSGEGLILQNNDSDDLAIVVNGNFIFADLVADGSDYNVSVLNHPLYQTCIVIDGSGKLNGANITNISIVCTTNYYSVGGTVSGLAGTLILQNNGKDDLNISTNTDFTFETEIAAGTNYNVSIGSEPDEQDCTVLNGNGMVTNDNVTDININCIDDDMIPSVVSTEPADGEVNYTPCTGSDPCLAQIVIVFSESMNTLPTQTLTMEINTGSFNNTPVSLSSETWSDTNFPDDTLNMEISWVRFPECSYIRWTVNAADLEDLAGNIISADVVQTFFTGNGGFAYLVSDSGVTADNTAVFGEDSDYINVPNARSFSGPEQHPVYTDDYTTIDNVTELVWKSCIEGSSGADCLGGTPIEDTWYNAVNACGSLNSSNAGLGYAGIKTWRLPSIDELDTLSNYGITSPAIDGSNFPNTIVDDYWSSSLTVNDSGPFIINFIQGEIDFDWVANSNYIRCVSGSPQFLGSFTDNGDGTVTDTGTNLIWQKCSWGQGTAGNNYMDCGSGSAISSDWESALSYCEGLSLAGINWHLPNINELKSILDRSHYNPSIDAAFFPNTMGTQNGYYYNTSSGWYIQFRDSRYFTGGWNSYYVRCVSGQ